MTPLDTLIAQASKVHAEAAGLLTVEVIRPTDAMPLLAAAFAGDGAAGNLARIYLDLVHRIEHAPRKKLMLCATCPRAVGRSRPYSVAVGMPGIASPQHAIGLAICPRCATEPAELLAKAAVGFRKIWPDLRPITIHPTGGSA